jgi:hypothetical protein
MSKYTPKVCEACHKERPGYDPKSVECPHCGLSDGILAREAEAAKRRVVKPVLPEAFMAECRRLGVDPWAEAKRIRIRKRLTEATAANKND